ncbi:hypothetical protein ACVIJW_000611 [Bradyrhizobium barranii subsp. barranii]
MRRAPHAKSSVGGAFIASQTWQIELGKPSLANRTWQIEPEDQWPKNSHNRMITGIGTPSIHSNSPRPITSSSNRYVGGTTRVAKAGSCGAAYQWPVFGIDDQGSAGAFGSPFCSSSIECRSGERTKAMLPSRGGRLMVTPAFISCAQVA